MLKRILRPSNELYRSWNRSARTPGDLNLATRSWRFYQAFNGTRIMRSSSAFGPLFSVFSGKRAFAAPDPELDI